MTTSTISDYLGLLGEPGIPPHRLKLKIGCVCSLARNLSIERGLVKNSRVVVKKLHRHIVEVELMQHTWNQNPDERSYCLPRINFDFKPGFSPWTIQRRQFPLRLAYATTFNSSQGLTLDKTVVDLRTPVFAHGQLYTSLSRVRNRKDIRIVVNRESNKQYSTTNIVYKDLLL